MVLEELAEGTEGKEQVADFVQVALSERKWEKEVG